MYPRIICTFLMVLTYTCVVSAQAEQIPLYAFDIPGIHERSHSGAYDRVVKKINSTTARLELTVLPAQRAIHRFLHCERCCLSPVNGNSEFYSFSEQSDLNLVNLPAINMAMPYVFTDYNTPPVLTLSSLAEKSVALRRGLPFGQTFFQRARALNIQLVFVDSLDVAFNMLKQGRVSAVVAYTPDAYLYFKEKDIAPYPHEATHPVVVHPDSFLCRGISQKVEEELSRHIEELRGSGELKEALGEVYQVLPTGVNPDYKIP
ncbi:transporter substrate-binding domain-containing protein [Oceanospirillum beijerinckii]|uniref:transporter substrate-binding domain-containing protein n=1 Tax=Oceanospirillum beijerinckii TaxID=64976 RepID=UPI000403DCE1|nr:transporter substrate-binding domain-containing protein [Oceanospirillum beijerinckii]